MPADFDAEALERRLVEASQGWGERLRAALIETRGEEDGNRLFGRFGRAVPTSYTELVDPRLAVPDITQLDRLTARSDRGREPQPLSPARGPARHPAPEALPSRHDRAPLRRAADPREHGPQGPERAAARDQDRRRRHLLSARLPAPAADAATGSTSTSCARSSPTRSSACGPTRSRTTASTGSSCLPG